MLSFLKDSFIIDNGKAGIWVWIGKKSSQKERQEAMRNALVCFVFFKNNY
jgi:hypothetical protein